MKLPGYIQKWSDDRPSCNGVNVVLAPGWSFLANGHLRSKTFNSTLLAKEASRHNKVFPCKCAECEKAGKGVKP